MFDKYTKAIVGSILAGLTSLQTAMLDGAVLPVEWVGVAISVVGVFGGVWGIGEFNAKVETKKAELAASLPTLATVPFTTTTTIATGSTTSSGDIVVGGKHEAEDPELGMGMR